MDIELWHLIIYFCIGLIILLKLNPSIVKDLVFSVVKDLLRDEEFLRDNAKRSREYLMDDFEEHIIPKIHKVVIDSMKSLYDDLTKDLPEKLPNMEDVGKTVTDHLTAFYARLSRKAQEERAKMEEQIKEGIQVADIQTSPFGRDAVMARIQQNLLKQAESSPWMGMVISKLLQGQGSSGNSGSGYHPPNQGGY